MIINKISIKVPNESDPRGIEGRNRLYSNTNSQNSTIDSIKSHVLLPEWYQYLVADVLPRRRYILLHSVRSPEIEMAG